MKKVSKKVKFLAAVLGSLLISSSAFAVDLTLDNSAVKRATAGQFSTDSDKVNAKDIFDLERSFFSAGYLGFLSSDGNGTTSAKNLDNGIQGSFGVALPAGMYLGIAAAYNLKDTANITTDKEGNTGTAINRYTIGSTGNFMAALRINDMIAVHYNLRLGDDANSTILYKVDHTKNKTANNDYKTYTHQAHWNHELAAAVKFGEHKLTIPVSVDVYADNTKNKGKEAGVDINNATYNNGPDYVKLNINPEFFLSLPMGPLTGINMGLTFGVGLNNNVGKNGTFLEQTVKNDYKTTQKALRLNTGVWASFPMEWSLANDQVSLAMEPQINLDFYVDNTYKREQTLNGGTAAVLGNDYGSDSLTIAPSIELPIGTLWRPVEWYELRFGTALILGADITLSETKAENKDNNTKGTEYSTVSGIAGFFGMGFIVTDDFNLDLYAEATQLNFFNMEFGGQLTYRFN
ncbi:hypothetical protein R4K48_13805 [Brachyspira pulli]|uniref:hypothetical protein n=1 Tax=Brachyspira pulli TaxID=310721 RepID=UPI0030074FA0